MTPTVATVSAVASIKGSVETLGGKVVESIKPVQRDDIFEIVKDKLLFVGVKWTHPSAKTRDIESYVLLTGLKHSAGGVEHDDYVVGDDGLRLFAHKHLGWGGDAKTRALLEDIEEAKKGGGRRRSRGAGVVGEEKKEDVPVSKKAKVAPVALAAASTTSAASTPPKAHRSDSRVTSKSPSNNKSQGAAIIDITQRLSPVTKKKIASRAEFMQYTDVSSMKGNKSGSRTPPAKNGTTSATVKVAPALSIDGVAFECHTFNMKLPKGVTKTTQQVTEGVVTYTVLAGDEDGIEVTYPGPGDLGKKQTVVRFSQADHFFIPFPNPYSIKNIGKKEALLSCNLVMEKGKETVEERLGCKDRAQWIFHFDDK